VTATVVRYQPRGAAKQIFESTAPELCVAGPAGTGKTLAALFRVHLTCLKVPNVRALILRQTHNSLTGTTLVTFEQLVAVHALAAGIVRWFGGSGRQPAAYRYSNGSTILVGGLDRPEKFLSAELDLIIVDEATETTERALETLISRLRGTALSNKQIILGCNPAQPTHWIKQRCDRGQMVMLHSRHRDNPALYNTDGTLTERGQDYMRRLDALTGVRRLRLRDGLWAAAEGVIYEQFDDAVHLIDQRPIPDAWTRWWTVDFGFRNSMVIQFWGEDPDGRLYLYREIYHTERLVEDHAKTVMAQVSRPDPDYQHSSGAPRYACHGRIWTEPKPRAIICDHDAEDRATLERHLGMSTTAAHKSVSDGIQAVQARLKPAGDGRPRLFVMRNVLVERDPKLVEATKPTCTVEEIPGYIWAPGPDGRPVKEEPLKQDDHGVDALRYAVAQLDLGARPRIRWVG